MVTPISKEKKAEIWKIYIHVVTAFKKINQQIILYTASHQFNSAAVLIIEVKSWYRHQLDIDRIGTKVHYIDKKWELRSMYTLWRKE